MKLFSYITGFVLSLALTLTAYFLVEAHVASGHAFILHEMLIPIILGLAFVQLIVQMIFFLHLHKESGPRWNLAIFISTVGIVFIILAGSLWIMGHVNHDMTPEQMEAHILSKEGIHRY